MGFGDFKQRILYGLLGENKMNTFKPILVVFLAFLGFSLMFHASVQALTIPPTNYDIPAQNYDIPAGNFEGDDLDFNVDMKLARVEGVYSGISSVQVSINRSGVSRLPTSVQVTIDGEVFVLPITNVDEDDCGSTVISASGPVAHEVQNVVLTDNSTRFCIETLLDLWTADVSYQADNGRAIGEMTLTATPDSVRSL